MALAFRVLTKTPLLTAVAVGSLALGIGANAAIFSIFDQVLFQSLPVSNPQELVNLSAPGPMPGSTSCNQQGSCEEIFSYPMFRDLEREQTVLAGIAGHRLFGASLAIDDAPSAGTGAWISGQYFAVLGVRPALGRLIGPDDDVIVNGHDVVVISHDLWVTRFGGRPDVVGRTMVVNGRTMEIIGVTSREFTGTTAGSRPAVYVPMTMRWAFSTLSYTGYENREDYWMYVFGRLKPGGSIAQAAAELNAVYRPILTGVEAPLLTGLSDATLERFQAKQILLDPGRRGQSSLLRVAAAPLTLLFAVTGTVLLIACANIANLLLARGTGRAAEMGVRLSLGATRRQLLAQLLTEALLLALLGGVASLVVATWTLDGIAALLPTSMAATLRLTLNPTVILFTGVVAVLTGLLFGLFPALHATRTDLITTIRAGAGQIIGGRGAARFRAGLATAQIALAMTLLVMAGLFLKSLTNIAKVDLGVAIDDVVTFNVTPSRVGYDTTRAGLFLRRIEEELAAIPGVTGMTSSMVPLLGGSNWGTNVRVQGFPCDPDTDCNANYSWVGPNFFTTMGMRLVAGRDLLVSDTRGAAPVVVVNQAFADKFNLGADAVGSFMGWQGTARDSMTVQIVGVVENVRYAEVKDPPPAVFYAPWHQDTRANYMNFYLRTSLPPTQLLGTIPQVLQRLDPTVPVEGLKTMPQQVRDNVFLDRMISVLSAAFAMLATLLAGIGLYGVLAYSVSQRTREIGVRMVLGADSGRVRGLIMRQMTWMVVTGGLFGVAGALVLGRTARSLLFELDGHDPVTFVAAVVLLALIALAAGLVPALRASRVDPMRALRYD